MDRPLRGRLWWGDRNVSTASHFRLRRQENRASLILADPYGLFDHRMRVCDLFSTQEQSSERLREALDITGVPAEALALRLRALSGSLLSRLALSQVYLKPPRMLLVDDIYRHVAPSAWAQIVVTMQAILTPDQALLLASRHPEALFKVDTVYVLYGGCFVEWGPRKALWSHPLHPLTQAILHDGFEGTRQKIRAEFCGKSPAEVEPGHWVREYI
jgi:peptide/nickel transport system ATP-binding protein